MVAVVLGHFVALVHAHNSLVACWCHYNLCRKSDLVGNWNRLTGQNLREPMFSKQNCKEQKSRGRSSRVHVAKNQTKDVEIGKVKIETTLLNRRATIVAAAPRNISKKY